MSIIVGGGTGFIGRHFAKLGASKGYKVISVSRNAGPNRITWQDVSRSGLPEDCIAVVSMSGEPILQPFKKWTPDFKERIRASRVDKTRLLSAAIAQSSKPPKVFVSLSGVSYYKPHPNKEYTEESLVEPYDYLSELTRDWERAAALPDTVSTRSVIVRTGVVLGKDGGMVQNLKTPFYLGAGGPIGSGKQWLPWIHVDDMVGIILFSVENDNVKGVLNGTAPGVVASGEFTKSFASAMWRPHLFPMPAFVVNNMFGSEAGIVMLEGQKVTPKRALELGYKFKYPDVTSACKELVS
ncbi:epimerase family protein SDR39U1 [Aplysia californica]|uniref:Epimerase family protein SDR39U1 n=1 Tax=Aplysia californica TaxID=6500 RepID=A0ABM0K638_APLCA|nr:epimerase family protein SDR39U1 [Aplysia californica]